ncbi:MAG TPA: response regulator [Planctomycetaceae bacterium]|nr:response regulator [Planctomycetaceae bacterium]
MLSASSREHDSPARMKKTAMSKKILLCDDDLPILRAAEFKIKKAGHDVRIATDGEEAWERIEESIPDILVTDCQMPRLGGLGLVERVRSHEATRHIPVLMLTAKGFELDEEDLAGRLEIRELIAKPFSPRKLLETIERILGEESGERSRLVESSV